jgi:hypothetical protein
MVFLRFGIYISEGDKFNKKKLKRARGRIPYPETQIQTKQKIKTELDIRDLKDGGDNNNLFI